MANLEPTIEKIRRLCTSDSFERGMQYFREGRVGKLDVSGSVVTAKVRGTSNYSVEINLENNFKSTCTCPYDLEGYCKHIVATLIALTKDYQDILKRGELERNTFDGIFSSMSAEQLRDFLKKEFSRNKSLKDRFMIYATGELGTKVKSVDDYKKEIVALIDDVSEYGYVEYGNEIDYSSFLDLAQRYIEKRNFSEAAKVYQALSEAIVEHMDMVDDSDGYYGDIFSEAVEGLSSCINSLESEDKARFISYLFEKFIDKETDDFQDVYDEALRKVCSTNGELKHLRKLLASHLPSSLPDKRRAWGAHYDSIVLLNMQIFVLDGLANLGDEESRRELYQLLGKYSLQDEHFCLLYAERLEKDGKLDEAVKVAEEGLRVFEGNLTSNIRYFLDKHHEALSPAKYAENLKKLFYQERNWRYYERLKKLSGAQWSSTRQEMIEHFSSRDNEYGDGSILIDIYVREKMFDAAIKKVIERKNLQTLSWYYGQLAEKYPGDYYNAYRRLLFSYADAKMGRDHYHEVAVHLEKMKAIKGFEKEFAEFLETLREKYAKRPAFLDEIRRL